MQVLSARLRKGKPINKGQTTRQRIIEQASPLFNQCGFAGCSLRDIMDATGLEKGTLYRHFSSKEEIAVEAFRFAFRASTKMRLDRLDPTLSSVGTLRAMIEQFIEAPSAVPGGCVLMNTAIDSDDGNAALRSLARDGVRQWKRCICAVVEKGKRSGEIRAEVRSSWLADAVIATLEGALMISRLEGSRQALRHAQAALGIVVDSIVS